MSGAKLGDDHFLTYPSLVEYMSIMFAHNFEPPYFADRQELQAKVYWQHVSCNPNVGGWREILCGANKAQIAAQRSKRPACAMTGCYGILHHTMSKDRISTLRIRLSTGSLIPSHIE